jgi:hypothetical protein
MQQIDDRILEYLRNHDWVTPGVIARHPHLAWVSEGRLRERLLVLTEAEFVNRVHNDMFELSRWGARYLDGDLDARNVYAYVHQRGRAAFRTVRSTS